MYIKNPMALVSNAVKSMTTEGSVSMCLAIMDPEQGGISFYYAGDCQYGIFRQKDVVMVEGLYESFNKAKKVGNRIDYAVEHGYI